MQMLVRLKRSLKSVTNGAVKSICGIERYEVGILLMIMSLMILAGYAVILSGSKILTTTYVNILILSLIHI